MHRLISTRTASHALRAARPLLQAPQTFAFSTLPRGTHLLTASQIQQQLRNYSPRKIKRDPYGAASQEQQQNTSYYEPENVTYSYPQYTSAAPPPGSVLQYSDGIANILSQPCLVMERKMEFMNVFLVSTILLFCISILTQKLGVRTSKSVCHFGHCGKSFRLHGGRRLWHCQGRLTPGVQVAPSILCARLRPPRRARTNGKHSPVITQCPANLSDQT